MCDTNMYFLFFLFSPLTTPLMCSFVNVTPWCLHLVVEIGRKKQFYQLSKPYFLPEKTAVRDRLSTTCWNLEERQRHGS